MSEEIEIKIERCYLKSILLGIVWTLLGAVIMLNLIKNLPDRFILYAFIIIYSFVGFLLLESNIVKKEVKYQVFSLEITWYGTSVHLKKITK